MAKMIFVNLPVADLPRSVKFYEALGFVKNEQFSNDQGTGMVWSNEIWVMLLTHDFFKKFTAGRSIPDAQKNAQVLNSLSFDSKKEVDRFAAAAVANGGTLLPQVIVEGAEGMVSRDITDLDGHIWEAVWMEMPG